VIDIENVTARTTCKVSVQFTGAPVTKVRYLDRTFVPGSLMLTYAHVVDATGDEVVQRWVCVHAVASGHRVLKPGPDGEVRVGKDVHDTWWDCHLSMNPAKARTQDLTTEAGVPNWVVKLANELRPAGYVETPGD
jgi:hypothetical protein